MEKRNTKAKGDLGEVSVIKALMITGWSVAIPFGENVPFDLIAYKESKFIRVQVKYRESKEGVLKVGLRSVSNGKASQKYTVDTVDILAVYDKITDRVFYIPPLKFAGKSELTFRYFPKTSIEVDIEKFSRIDV